MGAGKIAFASSSKSKLTSALKSYVGSAVDKVNALNNNILKSSYKNYYKGLMADVASNAARQVLENARLYNDPSWSPTNAGAFLDKAGTPYAKDGTISVVIANAYEIRLLQKDGSYESLIKKADYVAFFDSTFNRIIVSPWFAQAISEQRVRYVGEDSSYHLLHLEDVIHHEFGHRGDSAVEGQSTWQDAIFNNHAENIERIGQLVNGNGVSLPHNRDASNRHFPFEFRDDNGNWISQTPNNFDDLQSLVNLEKSTADRAGAPLDPDSIIENPGLTLRDGSEAQGDRLVLAALERASKGLAVIDGGQIGLALGSVLGKRLTSDPFGQVVASGALSTFLGGVGEFIDRSVGGTPSTEILAHGVEGFGATLAANIKGAGIGALSSYLTAELFKAVGLDGVPGEVANSAGGAVVSQILSNIPHIGEAIKDSGGNVIGTHGAFDGINAPLITNAIGSYIGTRLAAEIHSFDTVGGQIGAATGSIVGGFTATVVMGAIQGVELTAGASLSSVASAAAGFAAVNPVAAVATVAAVVLVEALLGGLIGSIFGGVPRSGADAQRDASRQAFTVANVYSKHGGSKDAARQMAGAVAGNLNAVLSASGSVLLDPASVQSGNYGMRKKDFVYRPVSTRDKDAITARFSGRNGAQATITHGSYLGIRSMIGSLAGGDVSTAKDYANYLANSTAINALIADYRTVTFMLRNTSRRATTRLGGQAHADRENANDDTALPVCRSGRCISAVFDRSGIERERRIAA